MSEAWSRWGGSSKERSRWALRWRNAKVGVRSREAILLMYIRRIPRRQAHASENENACISENALTFCNALGSLHTPAYLTDLLRKSLILK